MLDRIPAMTLPLASPALRRFTTVRFVVWPCVVYHAVLLHVRDANRSSYGRLLCEGWIQIRDSNRWVLLFEAMTPRDITCNNYDTTVTGCSTLL